MLLLRDNPQAASSSIMGAFSEIEEPEELKDDEEVGEGEDPTHSQCERSARASAQVSCNLGPRSTSCRRKNPLMRGSLDERFRLQENHEGSLKKRTPVAV